MDRDVRKKKKKYASQEKNNQTKTKSKKTPSKAGSFFSGHIMKTQDTEEKAFAPSNKNTKNRKRPWDSVKVNCFEGASPRAPKKPRLGPEDCNSKRALPEKILCNGVVIKNNFSSRRKHFDVKYVTSFFSNYSLDSNGVLQSDLVNNIVNLITKHGRGKTVVGCIAWLSNSKILNALCLCRRVLLIVNKEDYTVWGGGGMLEKYSKLPKFDEPLSVVFGHLGSSISSLENGKKTGKSKYSSVRAFGSPSSSPVGGRGRGGGQGFEHCKYLVFFQTRGGKEHPFAVLTGSANFTAASAHHHENSTFTVSDSMAMDYFYDFSNTFMASTTVGSKRKTETPQKTLKNRGALVTIK